MARNIDVDTTEFNKKIGQYSKLINERTRKAVKDIAHEILRLSQLEVPHDKGTLQNSGHVESRRNEEIVGYNTVYAARLHEHPEYRFRKGRKGKYLEDPIKANLRIFRGYMLEAMRVR